MMDQQQISANGVSGSSVKWSPLTGNRAEISMISGMRLLLSVSALLTLFINPDDLGMPARLTWLALLFYLLHSAVLFILARLDQPFAHGKLMYWLDVLWYGLIVFCTGGANSYFFPFFFFVILTSSFQHGLDEGARITLASSVLLGLASLAAGGPVSLSDLLLRITFVMALGYMIAYWGGLGLLQKRRLGLLYDISQQSNPRFGVDQTLAAILEKTRDFFGAGSCVLVMRENDDNSDNNSENNSGNWQLRTAMAGGAARSSQVSGAAAAPLLGFGARQTVLYAAARFGLGRARLQAIEGRSSDWVWIDTRPADAGADPAAALAELLDGKSFISTPLPLRKGEGRMYVVAHHDFARADAKFLVHMAAQVFPLIENIALLDRLASSAAYRERQKIARDLHDTTIQPYIGLRHGLAALRNSAASDNPLRGQIDQLLDMSGQVIGDLRQMAREVRHGGAAPESELLPALRRQAAQVKKFFGIDLAIVSDGEIDISDRLAAEVFQMVNEGISNIRKHSSARSARITLACGAGQLSILMENEHAGSVPARFMPGSIAERALALGGTVNVRIDAALTLVDIAIPV